MTVYQCIVNKFTYFFVLFFISLSRSRNSLKKIAFFTSVVLILVIEKFINNLEVRNSCIACRKYHKKEQSFKRRVTNTNKYGYEFLVVLLPLTCEVGITNRINLSGCNKTFIDIRYCPSGVEFLCTMRVLPVIISAGKIAVTMTQIIYAIYFSYCLYAYLRVRKPLLSVCIRWDVLWDVSYMIYDGTVSYKKSIQKTQRGRGGGNYN